MQILAYTIPAIVVLIGVWLIMHFTAKNEERRRMFELKRQSQKEISPIRLRAYERLTLLLERTKPEHLLMEMDVAHMSILDLQRELLRQVRAEFDHNMSQQVYVSPEVWDKIMLAKNETGAFITTMASRLQPNATAMDYAKLLLTAYNTNGDTPNELALDALKQEAKTLL